MNGESIYVVGLGASTAVGRNAWSSAAAVRAGISGFGQHPYMIDTAGEPMRVACAPWLDIGLLGVERFGALLFAAIDQTLASFFQAQLDPARVALFLGLPAPRPGLPKDLESALMEMLGEKYQRVVSVVATFSNGHASGLLALHSAMNKLEGAYDACLVAGVDSYMEPETLVWLEENEQLHSAGLGNNAWGFIPGEGAGALLLVQNTVAERRRLKRFTQILGVATGFESNRIKTKTICVGEGLTQTFRGVLALLPVGIKISDVYCDINGEPYRTDEYGFAATRTNTAFDTLSDFVAPADCWGDVGAAGSPLHLILASITAAKGYANGRLAFVCAGAEGGERGAALTVVGGSI